jgi:hypothetical protein
VSGASWDTVCVVVLALPCLALPRLALPTHRFSLARAK